MRRHINLINARLVGNFFAFLAIAPIIIVLGTANGVLAGPLNIIQALGYPIPGGGTVVEISRPFITRSGVKQFTAVCCGGDTVTYSTVPFFRSGDTAPGGGTFANVQLVDVSNTTSLIRGRLQDGSTGLFTRTQKIVLEGDLAPGGGTFTTVRDGKVGEDGTIAFGATVDYGGGSIKAGVFTQNSLIAVEGAPSPDGGVYTQVFPALNIKNDGTVVFNARTTITGSGDQGIFTQTLQLLAGPTSTGGFIVVSGNNNDDSVPYDFSSDGTIYSLSTTREADGSHIQGVFADLTPLIVLGASIGNDGNSFLITDGNQIYSNNNGDLAFTALASIFGAELHTLLIYDQTLNSILVAALPGDIVSSGLFISNVGVNLGGISDNGEVVFTARLSDGSVVAVSAFGRNISPPIPPPQPGTIAHLSLGLVGLGVMRRRRKI